MFYEVARNRGTVKAERPERATLTGWEKKKCYKNSVGGVYDGVRPSSIRRNKEVRWVINAFSLDASVDRELGLIKAMD